MSATIDPATETVVTVNQAAKHFGVSPATMWRLVLKCHLPSFKVGASRRLTLEACARYFTGQQDVDAECEAAGL